MNRDEEQVWKAKDLGFRTEDTQPGRCSMTTVGGGYVQTRRCLRTSGHRGECDFGPRDFEPPKGVLTP